jgi:hypothetical protein
MKEKHLHRHACPGCGEEVDWALTYCYNCGPTSEGNPGWVDWQMDPKIKARAERIRKDRVRHAQEKLALAKAKEWRDKHENHD